MPKVSVLIPTYNNAVFLDETIKSVLDQNFTDFELIIVDNASKDNTEEVVSKYLVDRRVTYYRNPVNIGLAGNWNKCLEYATGEYIKFLCSDDKFLPHLLDKYVSVMDQYPGVSVVTSNRQTFGRSRGLREVPYQHLQDGKMMIYKTLQSFNWIGEPTLVMFRRSNLDVGAFRQLIFITDMEMWLRQLTKGDCFFIPETLCEVREHAGQVTNWAIKSYINYFEEYALCIAIKENKDYKIDLSGIDINEVIKLKASKCAKVMFKLLPNLHKQESRQVFIKAYRIATKEKVLFRPVMTLFSKISGRNNMATGKMSQKMVLLNK